MNKKGFSYTIEDEKIIEYMKLTTEEKLTWLEEIVEFTNLVLTDKKKDFQTMLREGKI
jgi:hypothetical protein